MEKLNLIEIGKNSERSLCITEQEANRAIKAYEEGKSLFYENGSESVKIEQDGTMYIDGIDYIFNLLCPAIKDNEQYKKDRKASYQNKIKALVKKVVISDKTTDLAAAFRDYSELQEAVVPNSVTYIYNSFMNCPKLKAYKLPSSLKSVGGELFGIYPETLELPSGLEKIHESTFEGTKIKRVKIPSSLKELSYSAFRGCLELEEVIFEEGTNKIGTSSFENTPKLNNVVFPKSLKYIGHNAFYGCKSLENVTFLGQTSVERNAFVHSPCEKSLFPIIFDSIDRVEYKGDTSKINDYERIVSTGQGKTLYEQALSFCVAVSDYEVKSSYSDIDSEKSTSNSKPLVESYAFDTLVVKNGIIVGIIVKGKTVLAGECICTYYAVDEDGTGRDEVEEYTTLIFK